MSDLVDFLVACLDRDEEVARAANWRKRWEGRGDENADDGLVESRDGNHRWGIAWTSFVPDAHHIARHDPARVLAEVAAKRAIVEECADPYLSLSKLVTAHVESDRRRVLRMLAQPYAGEPGWDADWTTDTTQEGERE